MKNLQELLKQELLSNITERITPNIIKKKNKNKYQLNDTILKQINNFRKLKLKHERSEYQEIEYQENENQAERRILEPREVINEEQQTSQRDNEVKPKQKGLEITKINKSKYHHLFGYNYQNL